MAEYIGKEEVLKIVYNIKENKEIPKNYGTLLDIIRLVRNIPTADVVEVVRCEKCKYGDVSIMSKSKDGKEKIACYCNLKNRVTDVDYYCPSGERRDT